MTRLRQLYSVPVGLLVGIVLALLFPAGAPYLSWPGQIFLSVLKLLILPLVLVSIYASLAGSHDLRRIGGRSLFYFAATTAVAAVIGTLAGLLFARDIPAGLMDLPAAQTTAATFSLERMIASLVPSNLFASLAQGNLLHVVFAAVLAAIASRRLVPDHRSHLLAGARALDALLMQALNSVLGLAPIGVFGLVYGGMSGMDWASIFELHAFAWAAAFGALLHAAIVLPLLYSARTRRAPWPFIVACREPLLTAFSTASSNATYPVSKRALEAFGVQERISSFVLPLGTTLDMHGSAVYHAILLIVMSQLAGVELNAVQVCLIALFTAASAPGIGGIPTGGIVSMAFLLDLLGLPQTYLALYLVVDRFFDYPVTVLNVWGNLVVSAIVDHEVSELDR